MAERGRGPALAPAPPPADQGEPPPNPPPAGPSKRRRSLILDSGAVFVIGIAIQLIAYVPTYILAHNTGSTFQGQVLLGTIQTFLLVATTITNLGDLRIGSAYTFFVSRGQAPGGATTTYLSIRLAMVGLAGIALFLLAPVVRIPEASVPPLIAIWLVLPILWSTSTVYQNLWTSLGDAARGIFPQLVEAIARAATLTAVALLLATDHASHAGALTTTLTLWWITGAYLAGAVASSLVALPSLVKYRGRFDRRSAARLFRWSWPLMGSMVLLYLSGNLISFVVIGLLHAQQFNVFSAANAFRILILALPSAIAIPLFPHMSSLHKAEAFQAIRSRTWQTLRLTAFLVIPGVIALAIYRVNVINVVYGLNYLGGATALAILALAAIPASLSQLIATTMTSIGRTRLELYITSLQVVCLVAFSILFIQPPATIVAFVPSWATGINGAALAVLASSVGAFALNLYFLYTLLGVRVQARSLGWVTVSSAASFFAISRLNDLLPINRYYQLAAGIILGFLVYLLALAALGELAKDDVDLVVSSMGLPRSLGRLLAKLCWRRTPDPVNPLPPGGARALVPLEAEWLSEEGALPDRSARPPVG
jgi:O-antigen/teichoic acid export membrane protein